MTVILKGIELPRRRQGPFWSSVSILNGKGESSSRMWGLMLIKQLCLKGFWFGIGSENEWNIIFRVLIMISNESNAMFVAI